MSENIFPFTGEICVNHHMLVSLLASLLNIIVYYTVVVDVNTVVDDGSVLSLSQLSLSSSP